MERSQVLDAMGELKLYGMRGAYDEILATAVKRQHEPQRVVGALLEAEISEKHARSIKYQMTVARLPLAKDIDDFDFESENKRQLAGNIYLAKVTRVEPSLQAAFVEYGGNRHGFLAFSEISTL